MRYIPQLDGLRAIAILMVFASHVTYAPLLWAGVDLFFVLSGYLITGILLRQKEQSASGYFRPFYLRRARRILPPYFLFLGTAAIVFHIRWVVWIWCVLFSANVGLALGKIKVATLTPLWSLAVEEQFYLIWPCVVLIWNARTLKRFAFSAILVSPLLRAIATPFFHTHFPIYFLSVFRTDGFCAGALVAIAQVDPSLWPVLTRKAIIGGFVAGSALCFAVLSHFRSFHTGSNSILFNSLAYSLISLFFLGVLLFVLTLKKGCALAVLSWRPMRYLGKISYSFYLWHFAILLLLSKPIHSTPFHALSGFALTAAIATASWYLMEAPLLQGRSAPLANPPLFPLEAA